MEKKIGLLKHNLDEGYYIQCHRNESTKNLKKVLDVADNHGYDHLNIAYSGSYYERRDDGWWHTSDSIHCDRELGLPPEGKRVYEKTTQS